MIYVTHDQIEAMTLADRIVLLRDGADRAGRRAARSVRAPGDPLRRRLPRLAADELHPGAAGAIGGGWAVKFGDGTSLALPRPRATAWPTARAIVLGMRPEHISRAPTAAAGRATCASASRSSWCSRPARAPTSHSRWAACRVVAELQAHDVQRPGEQIDLDVDMNRAVLIDPRDRAGHSEGGREHGQAAETRHQAVRHRGARAEGRDPAAPAPCRRCSTTARCATSSSATPRCCAPSPSWCATRTGAPTRRRSATQDQAGQERLPRQLRRALQRRQAVARPIDARSPATPTGDLRVRRGRRRPKPISSPTAPASSCCTR